MTDVALKEYLERLIIEADRRYEQRFLAVDVSTRKSEQALKERLDGMNEFREALKDQANRMATREELERVDMSVQGLQQAKAHLDGRLMMLSAVVSILISVSIAIFAWMMQ